MHDTDTPQIAHLRDLEAKRTAAFDGGMTERQLIAAFYEMTRTHPQWSRITPPLRSNSPRAGDPAYEPCGPAPHMTRTGWLIAAGCCLAGACAWWWLLSWAAGVVGGWR